MISIIVPIYNGKKYIDNLVKSIDNQIYRCFEVIFIDDGSTDGAYEYIKIIQEKYKFKIVIVKQENKGVSSARNTGIRVATGDYICFVDIDDEITETYLLDMINILKKYNVGLVICTSEFFKINNTKIKENSGDNLEIITRDEVLKKYLYGKIKSGCCTIMVESKVLEQNNLEFAEGYKYNEDLHMMWRVLNCITKVAYLNKPLYIYKQHLDTAMSKFDDSRIDGLILMKNLEQYFKENNREFYELYQKYGVARIAWSLTWQAAIFLSRRDYKIFIRKNNIRQYIKKLLSFHDYKVVGSSIVYLLSPNAFRIIAKRFCHYRYKN